MTLSLSSRSPVALLAIVAVLSCASHVAADTQSVQSGNWSDPATWSTGQLPDASEAVTISAGDSVIYDLSSRRVAGVTVEDGATLAFHPDMHATLETDENVVVRGRLEMRPQAPNNDGWRNSVDSWRPYFIHTLRFVDVDETAFVGGGMDVLASDVGLWVMGDGVLDVVGAQKTGWVRLAGDARAGDTSIELDQVPVGWRDGDTIVIVPTEHPSVGNRSWNGFEERTIALAAGSTMHLDAPLSHDHPDVVNPFTGDIYTAEVLNLSRNVSIKGTANGRAHILIRSTVAQSIRFAELDLLGPRNELGRYPLHFHHNRDGSRGSLVEGVSVRNSENRAFVPHGSHGITFQDTVAFDIAEDAYWWDPSSTNNENTDPERSDDIVFDRAVAALVKDGPQTGRRLTGFNLRHSASGHEPVLRKSVAVGVQGRGFLWPETSGGLWVFDQGNVAHNNEGPGIFVWQNSGNEHIIKDFVAYRNSSWGVNHGAYVNLYQYIDVDVFENDDGGLANHALGVCTDDDGVCFREDGYALAFERFRSDGILLITKHRLEKLDEPPVLYKDCQFDAGVVVAEQFDESGRHDFVNCGLEPEDFDLQSPGDQTVIRVQRADGTAFQIDADGTVSTISAFYDAGDERDGGGDTEAPTTPSGLTATAISSSQIDLSWTMSTDNVGVTGYRIYRDGSLVATVTGTSHSDAGLSASTTYTYEVTAIDAADNESARSSPVSATTLADETDAGDDGSTDDGSTDDGSTDDGSTDDGSTDDGSTDDGSTDDGSTDDGSTDDGSTDDGSTDGGDTGGGDDPVIAWDGPQDFNGSSDFVDLGIIDIVGDALTLVARINADTWAGRDARIVSKALPGYIWELSERSNRLRLRVQTNGKIHTLHRGGLSTGVWHHVAGVYDGAMMKVYIDGVEVGSQAASGSVDTDPEVSAWVGAEPDGTNYFDGVIDYVHIYDRALSASEVAALAAQ